MSQGEPFNLTRLVSFAFIWGGAAVFLAAAMHRARAARRALKDAAGPA
ncbi:hypothetical protein [Brevundimonas abyssalis]|nr:hypothetical protein [Brevundimonas abyssalis]